ncbi:unnamed protein product [Discosporangium mesarthrocarpum]
MRRTTFLRATFALPVVVPIAVLPFTRSGIDPMGLFSLLAVSLVVGGFPYLVLFWVAWRRLRRADAEQLLRFVCVAPLWFLLPVNLTILLAMILGGAIPMEGWWAPFAFYSAYGLAVGYGYVALALGLYFVAGRLNLFAARRITSP